MASWRNSSLITICPECGGGKIKLARDGAGRQTPAQRVYYCPKCREVFSHEELVVHWPKKNMRVRLYPVALETPQTPDYEPLGGVSETV